MRVINYIINDDETEVCFIIEVKYKEFRKIISTKQIPKHDNSIDVLIQHGLECCKEKVRVFVDECEKKTSVVGRYLPISGEFLEYVKTPLPVVELSSELSGDVSGEVSVELELSSSLSV